MRLFYLFLVLFFLVGPATAQDETVAERANRTVKLLNQLYEEVGPEAGCILYDPCNVITLGDLRPLARWNGFKARSPEVKGALLGLNERSDELGILFSISEDGDLTIRSLEGLLHRSRSGEFSWVIPFPVAGDFADWKTWEKEQAKRAAQYCKSEGFTREDIDFHLLEGFLLGYPEPAVRRYMTRSDDPYHHRRAIDVGIAFRQELENGQPSYSILPEDCLEPEIVENVEAWSNFLQSVYEHPDVRKRILSKRFLEARRKVNPEVENSPSERWWREEGLQGIWGLPYPSLTRAHESVLYRHIDEIEQLLERGRPLHEVVLACQKWAFESSDTHRSRFSGRHLRDWFWWGSWSNEGPRGRFYRALAAAQPKLFAVEAEKRLKGVMRRGKDKELDSWELRQAALLYRHRGFQSHFPNLTLEEQSFVLEDIRAHFQTKEFKHLVEEVRRKGSDSVYDLAVGS